MEPPEIHVVEDKNDTIYICRRGRHKRYANGIAPKIESLAKEYHLDKLSELRNGTFIDCGANVGELGLWAISRGFTYVPFEPEFLEARCVDLNIFDGKETCRRQGLWNRSTTLTFYSQPNSADSSFIEFGNSASTTELDVVRLDEAMDLAAYPGPVILKLEAEGAEPEVLEGARDCLSHIDWVTVDCGYERGPGKEHTFVETNAVLLDHGFSLVAAQFDRVTALYRNSGRT